jgi:membrane-bound inhibitor of C-type lysozyme
MSIATLIAAVVVSSCDSTPPAGSQDGQRVYYNCADGRRFSALFSADGSNAALEIDGRRVTLPHVPSGSGATYRDGAVTLFTKGDNAFLEEDGTRTYADCIGAAAP